MAESVPSSVAWHLRQHHHGRGTSRVADQPAYGHLLGIAQDACVMRKLGPASWTEPCPRRADRLISLVPIPKAPIQWGAPVPRRTDTAQDHRVCNCTGLSPDVPAAFPQLHGFYFPSSHFIHVLSSLVSYSSFFVVSFLASWAGGGQEARMKPCVKIKVLPHH